MLKSPEYTNKPAELMNKLVALHDGREDAVVQILRIPDAVSKKVFLCRKNDDGQGPPICCQGFAEDWGLPMGWLLVGTSDSR